MLTMKSPFLAACENDTVRKNDFANPALPRFSVHLLLTPRVQLFKLVDEDQHPIAHRRQDFEQKGSASVPLLHPPLAHCYGQKPAGDPSPCLCDDRKLF